MFAPNSRLDMPELLYPDRKPVGNVQIDWGNPLTNDLVFATIINSTRIHDLVTGREMIETGSPIVQLRERGLEVYMDGVDDVSLDIPAISIAGDISYVVSCYTDNSNTSTRKRAIRLYGDGGSVLSFDYFDKSAWTYKLANGLFKDFGVAGSYAGAVRLEGFSKKAETYFNYRNGMRQQSRDDGMGLFSDITGVSIGSNSGSFPLLGAAQYCFVWSRGLSDSDHEAIAINPYQFLIPA